MYGLVIPKMLKNEKKWKFPKKLKLIENINVSVSVQNNIDIWSGEIYISRNNAGNVKH